MHNALESNPINLQEVHEKSYQNPQHQCFLFYQQILIIMKIGQDGWADWTDGTTPVNIPIASNEPKGLPEVQTLARLSNHSFQGGGTN